jgi:transposase-like protein
MEVCPMTSKYSPEFKQDAVKLAVESDQPISQTARALGINPKVNKARAFCAALLDTWPQG